jgi:hypothetical protein
MDVALACSVHSVILDRAPVRLPYYMVTPSGEKSLYGLPSCLSAWSCLNCLLLNAHEACPFAHTLQETFRKWREHILGFFGFVEECTDATCFLHRPTIEKFLLEHKARLPAYLAYLQVCFHVSVSSAACNGCLPHL